MAQSSASRRINGTRSAGERETHQEFTFEDPQLGRGIDIRSVKILSRDDWDRIQGHLHKNDIEAERRRKVREEKEELKQKSQSLVKNWTNTVLGARNKKLEERKERLEKDEKERKAVDIEEAKFEAEKRKVAIEKAKVQQYYQSDRVKGFHSGLILSEVLKERDAQIELKRLKAMADDGTDKVIFEKWQKDYEESIKKDQDTAAQHIRKARENAAYQRAQIKLHLMEKHKEDEENSIEGENIRRLAVAHALERQRMEQIAREEQRRMMQENLRQIADVKHMQEIQRLQEAEEDDECRLFAAAKKKMMRMRAEKEAEMHRKKMESLDRIKEKLSAELSAKKSDEEDRLYKALDEAEAKLEAEEAHKQQKHQDMMRSIAQQRADKKRKAEEEAKANRLAEMEMIRARKQADELYRRNEAEKSIKEYERARKLAAHHLRQREEQGELSEQSRKQQLRYDEENLKLVEQEEKQFQEYAEKVIEHCKKGGRNTYPLEKAAGAGAGGGLGPQFPGRGGIRPSYLTADRSGIQLPHYQRETTEDVKKTMYGDNTTHHRLGFVW